MKQFSETLPYRRVKYGLLFGVFVLLAAITVSIILVMLPYNPFVSAISVIMNFLNWYTLGDVSYTDIQVNLIKAANFTTFNPWINYWLICGFFLIFFAMWRTTILKGIGSAYVWFLKLSDSARFASGGNARFAGLFEEYQAKKNKGIYLGRSLFSRTWRMYDNDDRHMLTIAGARSGKGASCIIPNLLEWEDSVLCIDPKATNYNVTNAAREAKGKALAVDPFKISRASKSACFNPLSIIDPSSLTAVEDVRIISDALVTKEADGKNEHFTEGAKMLLDGYIVHVVTSGNYDNPSLIDVYEIVHMTNQEAIDIHAHMMANKSCGGLAQQAANRILETMGSNEYLSVVATLKTNLKWLSSEAFKETLSRSDFSFDEMKDNRMSVFLIIPPDLLVTHKRFLRLFVNVAISRYTRGGKAKIKGLFIIDECPALGYMEEIVKAYGELASYNLIMWAFFQDKGQIDKLYGERGQTFIGSSRAVQVFGIDDSDAEWVAGMIGTRGVATTADDTRTNNITAFRDAGSIRTEIGAKGDLQYILRSGAPALLLQRTPYFKSFYFQKLALPDPDHPSTNTIKKLLPVYSLIKALITSAYWILMLPYVVIIVIGLLISEIIDSVVGRNLKKPKENLFDYFIYIFNLMAFVGFWMLAFIMGGLILLAIILKLISLLP